MKYFFRRKIDPAIQAVVNFISGPIEKKLLPGNLVNRCFIATDDIRELIGLRGEGVVKKQLIAKPFPPKPLDMPILI